MTRTVTYLGCRYSMPGSHEIREDAYEQEREVAAFREPLAKRGYELIEQDWATTDPMIMDTSLYLIRCTWDYPENPERFAAFLETASKRARLANPARLIQWNMSKRYLEELAGSGLPVIPSVFIDEPGAKLADVRTRLGVTEIVLKPTFGGGGFGQRLTSEADPADQLLPQGIFAQPFLADVMTHGEISFIFVDGEFSHCVRKLPGRGSYLVQVIHGGEELAYSPTAEEIDVARRFVDALPLPALACRVDLLPTSDGLLLMELEAIEPHLFPTHGDGFAERFADAIVRWAERAEPTS